MTELPRRSFLGSLTALCAAPFLPSAAGPPQTPEDDNAEWIQPADVETWSGAPVYIHVSSLDYQNPRHQELIKATVSEYCQVMPDGKLWLPI